MSTTAGPEIDVDVLIIGAGLSGIGAACHLVREATGLTYAIVEMRERMGGTWDLFRYPGVRSDSDMYTLGYAFRPWRGEHALAQGGEILDYIRATAQEYDVEQHIHYGHKAIRADFDTATSRWNGVCEVEGRPVRTRARFLYACTGYYDYAAGYTPDLPGVEEFGGRVVHPQAWPADLEYADQRVVVIGSGATAVTLVPAMAERAGHVTMLQRSPSYVLNMPTEDPVAKAAGAFLPDRSAYTVTRWAHLLQAGGFYRASRISPRLVRKLLRADVKAHLPQDYPIDVHFTPRYNPWDQRLCLVPDADLHQAIGRGDAEVVTDTIDRFTATGIRLSSGRELPADLVVTATGLQILPGGGAQLSVDGEPIDLRETVSYKGIMLSGVPNFALALGYTNISWTLKVDLTSRYVCRLLSYMDRHGFTQVWPQRPSAGDTERPIIDFAAGYVQRAAAILPRQGTTGPWSVPQNYLVDRWRLRRRGRLTDGVVFSR